MSKDHQDCQDRLKWLNDDLDDLFSILGFLAIYCLYLSKIIKTCEESWQSLQIRVHMFIFFLPKFFSVVLFTWVSILSWRSLLNFGIFRYILLLFSLKMLYICKGKMILVKKCIIQQRSSRSSVHLFPLLPYSRNSKKINN